MKALTGPKIKSKWKKQNKNNTWAVAVFRYGAGCIQIWNITVERD